MRGLFRLRDAEKGHPEVKLWFEAHDSELGGIALKWFDALRMCGDDVTEVLHDNQPTACVNKTAFAYVDVFKAHVNLGFFHGVELPDPDGLLVGTGKFMRHVKLSPKFSVDEDALLKLVQASCEDIRQRLEAEHAS
ncbi:DUF1801 domain-containing protein [Pseudohongiella sp. O18]|uniref:DUF1801 domain-containing protein n=1 Tax=Pseudohongiella sp. O18 TaxID=2904248 RepID=UPI001F2217D6|nr:DUF1801 domain-containing protein [Pseudohongiella sp. O18]